MSKYHQLVKDHEEQIAKIKALKARHEELVAKANAVDPIVHPEPDWDAIAEQEELFAQAEEVYQTMCICYDELHQDIEAAYHDVPFAKPRQAGIKGFWKEAGL